ncbi:MAG: hypothetical protein R3D55_00065 [Chloroflexota bacterium]
MKSCLYGLQRYGRSHVNNYMSERTHPLEGKQMKPKPNKPQEDKTAVGVALGISLGLALGAALGLALGNIAVGIGSGIAIGAALGLAFTSQPKS